MRLPTICIGTHIKKSILRFLGLGLCRCLLAVGENRGKAIMANEEHLEILKQGPVSWNRWLDENSNTQPDLVEADLSRVNLSEADLAWADLRGANLIRTNLTQADLFGARLNGANLSSADIRWADLRGAKLCEAILTWADLSETDIEWADLSGSKLRGADLRGADLSRADLRGADLSDSDLRGANLRGADLRGADLRGADLSGYADLRGTAINDFTQLDDKWLLVWEILNKTANGRDLNGANLSKANLKEAVLSEAKLSEADLSWADLGGADLSWAALSGANLSRANLSGANLSGANLTGANLTGADVSRANFRGAKLSEAIIFGAYLSEANFSRANLSGANLNQSKLFKAKLNDADLTRASLVKTDLEGVDLTGCHVYGISAWDLNLAKTIQKDLVITLLNQPVIVVDGIEVAQFLYFMLNNKNIRGILDTISSKSVLILGHFKDGRKAILNAIRDELRKRDYLPILFEFDKMNGRDLTETVSVLAQMSRYIIADVTDAAGIPAELQEIVPELPTVPIRLIIEQGSPELSLLRSIKWHDSVLEPYQYEDPKQLIASLGELVMDPVELKVEELQEE